MALLSSSASRLAVIGLAVASLGGLYALFRLDSSPVSTAKTRAEAPSVRRGDDPTYADELRAMTALLQDMRYRFEQTENQRIVDRERAERAVREATQEAAQQSRQEADRLNQALREAREAADQKISELAARRPDSGLKQEIDRLTDEVNALRAHPPARAEGKDGASGPENRTGAGHSEANRVLAPSGEAGGAQDRWPRTGYTAARARNPGSVARRRRVGRAGRSAGRQRRGRPRAAATGVVRALDAGPARRLPHRHAL